nr:hypothetical protein Itr_chr10CG17010 [Ipomoea trifida]
MREAAAAGWSLDDDDDDEPLFPTLREALIQPEALLRSLIEREALLSSLIGREALLSSLIERAARLCASKPRTPSIAYISMMAARCSSLSRAAEREVEGGAIERSKAFRLSTFAAACAIERSKAETICTHIKAT